MSSSWNGLPRTSTGAATPLAERVKRFSVGATASNGGTSTGDANPLGERLRRFSVGSVASKDDAAGRDFTRPRLSVGAAASASSTAPLSSLKESDAPQRRPGLSLSEFEQDAHVWITDHEQVWLSGKVSSQKTGETNVILDVEEGEDERVIVSTPALRGLRRNEELLGDGALRFDDLTEVPILHEAAVLQALDVRFEHGVIYTLSGPVLLAVNPFRTLPGIYSPQTLGSFVGDDRLRPHVFSIANHAYQGIRQKCASQTVLVSGESGSGKTETTKHVMQFLALAGAEAVLADGSNRKSLSKVERQVLGSNPLLEAFGNAKTLRNDNSSRFGKYTELQFGFEGNEDSVHGLAPRLVGARVHTYLLEQVRVTEQQAGERSFHIFYQTLAAASRVHGEDVETPSPSRAGVPSPQPSPSRPSQQDSPPSFESPKSPSTRARAASFGISSATDVEELDLHSLAGRSAMDFAYLRRSAHVRLENADDDQDFNGTLGALRTVGFSRQELIDVFRVLAAVLFLGNIDFEVPPNNSEASKVATPSALDSSRERLGVTAALLESAMCVRSIQSPEGLIRKANTVQQAAECREATARHLYQTAFRSIVKRTNHSIGFRDQATFCGVLDIFGFEFFQVNSFEQLCINFTNELLQQYFNTFIFENEEALYNEEGISFMPLDFPDNSIIVTLLHQNPTGILPMLDEECFVISGTSEAWEAKLVKTHGNHPRFRTVKHQRGTFIVEHFAGPVTYTSEGFMEKNRDRLSPDVIRCMQSSSCIFLRDLYTEYQQRMNNESSAATSSSAARTVRRRTVSSEFRQQLNNLMDQIRKTSPHFVRCIKPNKQNKPFAMGIGSGSRAGANLKPLFDRKSVAEQLNYQGVLEAIRVARAGYPVRFLHADFFAEFRVLAHGEARKELEAAVKKLTDADPPGADTNIVRRFLELPEVNCLLPEALTGADGVLRVTWALGTTKVFLKQDTFGSLKAAQSKVRNAASTKIQARYRAHRERRTVLRRWVALRTLQAHARGRAARLSVRELRRERAGAKIVMACRTLLVRDDFRRMRLVAKAAQSWTRMRRCQVQFSMTRKSLVKLQAWWRSSVKRRRWRTLPKRILTIQRLWRGSVGRRRALEWKAAQHRLYFLVRKLVRFHRKRVAHRRWRSQMMEAYRGFPAPSTPTAATGETLKQLQRDYACLEHKNHLKHDRVKYLRKENDTWKEKLDIAKAQYFPSFGF